MGGARAKQPMSMLLLSLQKKGIAATRVYLSDLCRGGLCYSQCVGNSCAPAVAAVGHGNGCGGDSPVGGVVVVASSRYSQKGRSLLPESRVAIAGVVGVEGRGAAVFAVLDVVVVVAVVAVVASGTDAALVHTSVGRKMYLYADP